jgi:hypothetical protein
MAKACEHGWEYDFFALENRDCADLKRLEQLRIAERRCDLNTGRSWPVLDSPRLTVADLCARTDSELPF